MGLVVGYDATAAVRQRAGIGRYTRELLGALVSGAPDIDFRTFACTGGVEENLLGALPPRIRHRNVPVSDRMMNAVWHRGRLPAPVQIFTGAIDLYHSPDFTLPPVWGRPTILTIHDLAFLVTPENAYPTLRAYLERVVPTSVRRARHIIAVSECTRNDLIRLLGVAPDCVTTVLEGVSPEFRPAENDAEARQAVARFGIRAPYLLAVGTLEPRKNYVRLLEAYHRLRARGQQEQLVICGRAGWLHEPFLERRTALELEQHVLLVEADDEQLLRLYQCAVGFVYPSVYEGFGLPPLEAMACGTPVACSNTSSLPEVVGDAALTFDPLDIEDIATALRRLLEDSTLRTDLSERGRRRAAAFTWQRAAAETVAVYRRVANAA